MNSKLQTITVLIITMFFTSIAHSQTDWSIFQYDINTGITTNLVETGYLRGLSTDGRYVTWRAGSVTEHLYVYDTLTNTTTQLTTGTTGSTTGGIWGFSYPHVSDGKAVWTNIYNPAEPVETEIVLSDLQTGTQQMIAPRPGYKIKPRISGSRVVWHESINGSGAFNALDFSTGDSTVLHSSWSKSATWADVSGNIAVYEMLDITTGIDGIYGFDFSTDQEFLVHLGTSPGVGSVQDPKIDGDWVAWTQSAGGQSQIMAKNLLTNELLNLGRGGSCEISSDFIVINDVGGLTGYNFSSQTFLFSGLGFDNGHIGNLDWFDIADSKVYFTGYTNPEIIPAPPAVILGVIGMGVASWKLRRHKEL